MAPICESVCKGLTDGMDAKRPHQPKTCSIGLRFAKFAACTQAKAQAGRHNSNGICMRQSFTTPSHHRDATTFTVGVDVHEGAHVAALHRKQFGHTSFSTSTGAGNAAGRRHCSL